MSFVGLLKPFF